MSREIRKTKYPSELFLSKEWKLYWIGKSPKTHDAVTEYLSKYGTEDAVTQVHIAVKYGITDVTIIRNIHNLKKLKIIPCFSHLVKRPTNEEDSKKWKELLRGKKKYASFYEKQKSLGYVLCGDCLFVNKSSGNCKLNPYKRISVGSWRKCKRFKYLDVKKVSDCSNFRSRLEHNVRCLMGLLPTKWKEWVLSETDRYTRSGPKGETVIDYEQMYDVIMEAVEHAGIVVGEKT